MQGTLQHFGRQRAQNVRISKLDARPQNRQFSVDFFFPFFWGCAATIRVIHSVAFHHHVGIAVFVALSLPPAFEDFLALRHTRHFKPYALNVSLEQ